MQWLILLHVLSAIVGLGPAYAFPLLLKKEKSVAEAGRAAEWVARLEVFPKLFGTLAFVSGLVLFWLGSYGSILSLWLIGTLILYAVIEAVVIGFLAPAAKKLSASLSSLATAGTAELDAPAAALYRNVRSLHVAVTALSTIIIVLMIMKPV